MMQRREVDAIELFIDELASRAPYGYAGEKPLAVIAALDIAGSTMNEEKMTLSEALKTPLLEKEIKRRFIQLARETGKLKDPDSSWGNVVTSKKELLQILRERKTVDAAFKTLDAERLAKIRKNCYLKLGL
jgi:hypothetical protein